MEDDEACPEGEGKEALAEDALDDEVAVEDEKIARAKASSSAVHTDLAFAEEGTPAPRQLRFVTTNTHTRPKKHVVKVILLCPCIPNSRKSFVKLAN